MSLTLLEKQGTIQYPQSGALINYHALGRQSGRLFGCDLVQATSENIVLTSGVLVIRGYRIVVLDETLFDVAQVVAPAEPMRYYILIRLDAGTEDTEMELFVTDEAPVNNTPIEEQTGVYDYVLGVFNFGPGGISEFTSLIETIDTTKSNSSGEEGPTQEVDLSNYYTKVEIDNLLANITVDASDELSLIEGILTIGSITSSTMTFLNGTLTIE